ncbi:hypothetical protein JFK97_20505 [Chromobacterium phragmitis]|uniref:nucleic acid/nucleotide deaminase domain-containing protein n=1 Tax=Chromobacterium amazonense TaxID=1382803 RepID=UPI0021B713F9|nr:nucleic acid/nucleotide deaminase domain-containing protein [Chromobacterium amazonense]MBM2886776.1 hypothetical protein [Chromobacterium amazonense]MDE1715851.1 nucleic acid/nucleotide deaminase domain-containing protein [Chromobacterium amazonense]
MCNNCKIQYIEYKTKEFEQQKFEEDRIKFLIYLIELKNMKNIEFIAEMEKQSSKTKIHHCGNKVKDQVQFNNKIKNLEEFIKNKSTEIITQNDKMKRIFIGSHYQSDTRSQDERDLDSLCRIIHAAILIDDICVAACWAPLWLYKKPTLIISTNTCSSKQKAESVRRIISTDFNMVIHHFLVNYKTHEKKNLKDEYQAREPKPIKDLLIEFSCHRSLKKIMNRDNKILKSAISDRNFKVIHSIGENVHAELRILEFLQSEYLLKKNEHDPRLVNEPLYIGVSLLCCSKCAAFIYKYHQSKKNSFVVFTRGVHGTMDTNWVSPQWLTEYLENSDYMTIIERSQQTSTDLKNLKIRAHMNADMSDSEYED